MDNHEIDYSRCVACMDCLDTCKEGAIKYTYRYKTRSQSNHGRRTFIISSLLLSGGIAAKAGQRKLGLKETDTHKGNTPLVPAGSLSVRNFTDHCTACQLCINACPEKVLKPSDSLANLMQPEMVFDRGYCSIECNECSTVCPAGAIKPISPEDKSSVQIGHAVINPDLCVVNTDNVKCLGCSRNCPVGAIRLVYKNPDDENSLLIPTVNEERCIGCGACEHYCPARPIKAIHVEGHQVHKMI
jgi:ferredoxin